MSSGSLIGSIQKDPRDSLIKVSHWTEVPQGLASSSYPFGWQGVDR